MRISAKHTKRSSVFLKIKVWVIKVSGFSSLFLIFFFFLPNQYFKILRSKLHTS